MNSDRQSFSKELDALLESGEDLLRDFALRYLDLSDELREQLEAIELPDFRTEYESWYTVASRVVKQVTPDRYADFTRLYRDDKRKKVTYLTYGVSDALIGLETTHGMRTVTNSSSAYSKFEQQLSILNSVKTALDSRLLEITEVLQADLFDTELESARELLKKGFLRAAGVTTGVVLEKHLAHVCNRHHIKTRKKRPTINDFNQMLKDQSIIDTPMWRRIQHLADIRNLCGHDRDREPTQEEVEELISGISGVVRTLF